MLTCDNAYTSLESNKEGVGLLMGVDMDKFKSVVRFTFLCDKNRMCVRIVEQAALPNCNPM